MRKTLSLVAMLILWSVFAWSQTKTITGQVTDLNGDPVPFATIAVKGSTTGVAADQNGSFNITANPNAVLVVSAAGFEQQEVQVGDQSTLSVLLVPAANLQEVVVTAIGISRQEKALGYSVSQVNPGSLVQNSEPDMLKGLQGKVAGVDIRQGEGTPGAATRINIRGYTSFFGNNEPLIIVDGVSYDNAQFNTSHQLEGGGAYQNGLSSLDPNDIASLSVLKGSAAAALYGSRASNGVLVIKTKSGSAGRTRKGSEVTYSSSVSFENVANLPEYQNSYGAGSAFTYSNANGSWGPKFGTLDSIATWPDYLAAFPDMFGSKVPYQAYPNNVKDLFKTGIVTENSISVSGGDEKTSLNATATTMQHSGYVPNSNFRRNNIAIGGVTHLDNGLIVRGNFSYGNTGQKGSMFGENQIDGVASSFARSLFLARNWDLNLPYEDVNGLPVSTSKDQYDNPRWSNEHNVITTNSDRYVAGLSLEYDITKWLNASYQIGSNTYTMNRLEVTDIGSRAAERKGEIVEGNYRTQTLESNFLLNINPKLKNRDFTLKAIIGHNVNQRTEKMTEVNGKEIISPGIYTLANTKDKTIRDTYSEIRRLWGVFGDVTLGYRNYLFLNATGRNDWSSTLPKENRSYFYPSASASFVFSDAFNMQSDKFSLGKIRAAWAQVGRDADPYFLQDTYVVLDPFLGQSTARASTSAANANLKPEFTTELEFGVNLEFFARRLGFDVTYYEKKSTNQIAPIDVPSSTGYQTAYANFGSVSNKGWEIEVHGSPVRNRNFNWEVRGTFTKIKSVVESLTEGLERLSRGGVFTDVGPYFEPGLPYGYIRGSISARDNQGNLLIDPSSGMVLNAKEPAMIGNPNPDFKAGLINTFTYKGFFLNAVFDVTKGGDLYSVTLNSMLGRGVLMDTEDRESSWIIPGVYGDPDELVPLKDSKGQSIKNVTRLSTNDLFFAGGGTAGTFAINGQDEWSVYDATVYHFRELTIGYNLPKSLFNKVPIGGATLSFSGRNLWFYAPYVPHSSNFDPEVSTYSSSIQGFEFSTAPTTRRLGVNLKITF
ncbi:MAG: SusC/RagA family TonB-linked outer membrane protein [Chitinophagaceae bacterium]|nr:SusC/RagA family TonB-linked outer membrane protein [Chitinophagaceae bacterium]